MSSAAAPIQFSYRFATPITGAAHEAWTLVGTVDTSFEITIDTDYALIIKVGNSGDMQASGDFQLQYNVGGAGFNDVNATSSNVRSAASGDVDDATSTTERLTTSARTFDVSTLDEVDGLNIYNVTGGMDVEFYYTLNFRSAELSGGESVTFRLLSGGATFDSLGAGSYDITPTATVPVLAKTGSGTPSIASPTASGVATIFKTATGTATAAVVTAVGVAAIVGVLTASGTPSIDSPLASGSAKIIKLASGTPSIDTITALGVATIVKSASGTPAIDTLAASGVGNLAPKVWLNTSQTISGATEMTRTAFNLAGTSITFTDPASPPIGSLFLGVENRNAGGGDSNAGWIAVTVGASRQANGTPSIDVITASGTAAIEALEASGTPSIDEIIASGTVIQTLKPSGTPSIDGVIASGTATNIKSASGTPAIESPTAVGTVTQTYKLSGTPSIETITASGVAAKGEPIASGTPSIEVITANGLVNLFGGTEGMPTIEVITASGVAQLKEAISASGTPSIAEIVASGNVTQTQFLSGAPSIETITASGVASVSGVDEVFFGAGDDQRFDEDELMLAIIKDVAGKLM